MKEAIKLRENAQAEFYTEEKCFILELSNSDDDMGLSIARVRVEPGVTTSLHRLRGTVERYVILTGKGRMEVGELAQDVGPEDVVIIPAGCPQRITNTQDEDLVFLVICTPRFQDGMYEDIPMSD